MGSFYQHSGISQGATRERWQSHKGQEQSAYSVRGKQESVRRSVRKTGLATAGSEGGRRGHTPRDMIRP